MIRDPDTEAKRERKAAFMVGFKKGVTGAAYADTAMLNADFKQGHEEGCKAASAAHKAFCESIGHDPSMDVLR